MNIQKQYDKFKAGELSGYNLLREARLAFPNFITQNNSLADAVRILVSKGLVVEAQDNNKEKFEGAIDIVERGIRYELGEMGMSVYDCTTEAYTKARQKAMANVKKDPAYYANKQADVKAKGSRHDQMQPVTKGTGVDVANAMKVQKLQEAILAVALKRMISEGMEEEPQSNLVPLKSIGAVIDTVTAMIYPMNPDGTADLQSPEATHIKDADHYSIMDEISPEDQEIYNSVLTSVQGPEDESVKGGVYENQMDMFATNASQADSGKETYFKFLRAFAKSAGKSEEELGKMSYNDLEKEFGQKLAHKHGLEKINVADKAKELIAKGVIQADESVTEAKDSPEDVIKLMDSGEVAKIRFDFHTDRLKTAYVYLKGERNPKYMVAGDMAQPILDKLNLTLAPENAYDELVAQLDKYPKDPNSLENVVDGIVVTMSDQTMKEAMTNTADYASTHPKQNADGTYSIPDVNVMREKEGDNYFEKFSLDALKGIRDRYKGKKMNAKTKEAYDQILAAIAKMEKPSRKSKAPFKEGDGEWTEADCLSLPPEQQQYCLANLAWDTRRYEAKEPKVNSNANDRVSYLANTLEHVWNMGKGNNSIDFEDLAKSTMNAMFGDDKRSAMNEANGETEVEYTVDIEEQPGTKKIGNVDQYIKTTQAMGKLPVTITFKDRKEVNKVKSSGVKDDFGRPFPGM